MESPSHSSPSGKQLAEKDKLDVVKGSQASAFSKLVIMSCGARHLCSSEWETAEVNETRQPTEEDAVDDLGVVYDSTKAHKRTRSGRANYLYHHDTATSPKLTARGNVQFDKATDVWRAEVKAQLAQRRSFASWLCCLTSRPTPSRRCRRLRRSQASDARATLCHLLHTRRERTFRPARGRTASAG